VPNWSEILQEVNTLSANGRGDALDVIRRKYLNKLSVMTGRNTIAYYLKLPTSLMRAEP
jgi:hypothetical protein